MSKFVVLSVVCATVILTGCKSEEKPPEKYVNVPLYMAGNSIPADSQEKIIYNPEAKAYSVGRRLDDNGVMQEAGTVYRIEKGIEWNLVTQADANPRSFAQAKQQELYAQAMTGQVNRSISEMQKIRNEINASLIEQRKQTNQISTLQKDLIARDRASQIMTTNIKLLKDYIDKLDKKIDSVKLEKGFDK